MRVLLLVKEDKNVTLLFSRKLYARLVDLPLAVNLKLKTLAQWLTYRYYRR